MLKKTDSADKNAIILCLILIVLSLILIFLIIGVIFVGILAFDDGNEDEINSIIDKANKLFPKIDAFFLEDVKHYRAVVDDLHNKINNSLDDGNYIFNRTLNNIDTFVKELQINKTFEQLVQIIDNVDKISVFIEGIISLHEAEVDGVDIFNRTLANINTLVKEIEENDSANKFIETINGLHEVTANIAEMTNPQALEHFPDLVNKLNSLADQFKGLRIRKLPEKLKHIVDRNSWY